MGDVAASKRNWFGRQTIVAIVVVAMCAAGVATILVYRQIGRDTPGPPWNGDGIRLSFEYGRKPITRVRLIDLCDKAAFKVTFAECSEDATVDGVDGRPRVLSAYVSTDLPDVRPTSAGQFPASRIKVAATNEGQRSLLVTVVADPSDGLGVDSGHFSGTIVVERVGDPARIETPLRVDLRDRGGWLASGVAIALFVGAAAGAFLKWMNDYFTPVADLRRRYVRFNRWLRWNRSKLPDAVVRRLTDVAEAVNSFDVIGVQMSLDSLTAGQEELAKFVVALERLDNEIDQQRRWLEFTQTPVAFAADALQAEQDFIDDARAGEWPWPDNGLAILFERLGHAESNFRIITRAARNFGMARSSRDVHARLQGLLQQVAELGTAGLGEPTPYDGTATFESADTPDQFEGPPPTRTKRQSDSAPTRHLREWALDHCFFISSAVGAAVIAFVGYQTQFLDNAEFNAGAGDFVRLAAWSLALQIAGTTVVQVVGRLTSAAPQ